MSLKLYLRTPTLGSVSYRGQRGFIVAALTDPEKGIPDPFTRDQVVAALDPAAYEMTFKHGRMAMTIEASVQHHLGELVELGQLENPGPDGHQRDFIAADQAAATP